ncbi:hypothetical protein VNO77_05261 [Canavalia gladiata]|uniref:Uncharacterized protein n=1 Tax=Canavalia gladiata TaxID=3824 RepID=A0AAN9N024_CANGL
MNSNRILYAIASREKEQRENATLLEFASWSQINFFLISPLKPLMLCIATFNRSIEVSHVMVGIVGSTCETSFKFENSAPISENHFISSVPNAPRYCWPDCKEPLSTSAAFHVSFEPIEASHYR